LTADPGWAILLGQIEKENSMRKKEDIEAELTLCEVAITEQHNMKALLLEELISCNNKETMGVYDLWRGACISRSGEPLSIDEILRFDHRDGSLAICYDIHGDRVNLGCTEEVYVWKFGAE
jgi:hypothetical protein